MVPLNVKVPVPSLVNPPVVFAVVPLTVSVVAVVLIFIFETVPAVSVMFLSVDAVAPEYFNSPPPNTSLAAALVACPKLPATPPFPMVPTLSVPKLMVTPPVKVFTPDNVKVPVPVLVKEPVPLMTPDTVAIPAPVPPNMAAVERVMAPDAVVAVALLFTKEPLMVNGSAELFPFKSTVAPDAMMVMAVVAVVAPKPVVLPSFIAPALTVVMPLYVFTALNVQVPTPVFCKVPVLLITPDAVASPVPPIIAAVVRVMVPDAVAAVALLFTRDPLLVKISEEVNPFKSTVAPDEMVVSTVEPNAVLLPNFSVPVVTVVAALYVFTPDKVHIPAPVFCRVPVLLIIPDEVTLPLPPKIAAVVRVMAPDAIEAVALLFTKEPLTVKSSAVVNPFKSKIAANEMVVLAVVPKAALLPNFKVPTLTVPAPL